MGSLMSVKDTLIKTGIARATLYRMIDEGLPFTQVGLKKKLFDPDEVIEFMGKRKNDLISKLEVRKEYSNEDICAIFKCSTQGGMRRSHSTGALVLTSHHDDPNNAYIDYWQGNIFYYTGMGMEGDQDLYYAQNKTLAESNSNGIVVYLFEVFSSRRYMYRGIVKLVDKPFTKIEVDFSGNERTVWKFPLHLINQELLPNEFLAKEQSIIGRSIKTISDLELRQRIATVDGIVRSRLTRSTTFEYNLFVREYAKRRAQGRCQLCEDSAPFEVDGAPYLKTYHLVPLSKGGLDTPQNVGALCPNCYEKLLLLHSDDDKTIIQQHIEKDDKTFSVSIACQTPINY